MLTIVLSEKIGTVWLEHQRFFAVFTMRVEIIPDFCDLD